LTGWEEIRAEVQRRIRTRIWPLGASIPGEEELAAEFGCARATVNRALRDLAAQGVLERRRKAGTRVVAVPVRKATLDIPVIRQEVERLGRVHGFRVLARTMATPPDAVAGAMGVAGPLVYLETLHLADCAPFVFEVRWLNPAGLPALPDFTAISANEWLVTSVSYATGEIAFAAEPASQPEARALGVPEGAALFITERITRNAAGIGITQVRLAHAPGYRLRTVM
jgi:GntR family transcriptional regulator, histidine utilization repressor